MMFRAAGIVLILAFLCHGNAVDAGGKFNKKLTIGGDAPTFSGLPGVDGKRYSLADFKDKEVVVLVVTCNHCPVAQAYQDRLIEFSKKYTGSGGKVGLLALNVNREDEDSLPQMIKRAKEKNYNFPYVFDESQRIGRDLGATVTPEFFVLDKNRKVVFMGGMDDAVNPKNVRTNFLVPAVEAALKGKTPEITETAAVGCSIFYDSAK
jgi:peroxiredoxin